MAGVKTDVAEVKKNVARCEDMLTAVYHVVNANGSSNVQPRFDNIPRTEVGSNSVHRPSQLIPRNLFSSFDTFDPLDGPSGMPARPKVTLLDRDSRPVAKGYIVIDATSGICHGRKVGLGEKNVHVEEVLVGNALVYNGPQDGNTTLQGFVEGGYLIWLSCRMQNH